jgi:hypothetical protein
MITVVRREDAGEVLTRYFDARPRLVFAQVLDATLDGGHGAKPMVLSLTA